MSQPASGSDPLEDLLREQIAYYRARAQEYDETLYEPDKPGARAADEEAAHLEMEGILNFVQGLGPLDSVLELACGTGIWTQLLARLSPDVMALDASPEMLAVNAAKVGSPQVRYALADLFQWQPERRYDLVFFAFWLSHVPAERLDAFLAQAAAAVRPGGQLLIIDEPAGGGEISGPTGSDQRQLRELRNKDRYTIIKAYYDPAEIAGRLQTLGLAHSQIMRGRYFFTLLAK